MTPVKTIAVDYGGYVVTFQVSPSPPQGTSADETCLVPPGHDEQAQDHEPPPADGGPTACCPVCGAPAEFPPPSPQPLPPHVIRTAERTARVLAWMAANCHRTDVTAAEIAETAGLSVRRLEAVCKRDFGSSPLRLMADMRLHRAHLALTGRAPAPASLAEAASLAGHSRLTRFRAAYRARYGRNPVLPPSAASASCGKG